MIVSRTLGQAPAVRLEGEAYANYFFLTPKDQLQDLRMEGDFNLKLHVPIWRNVTIAPFFDFYYFGLKIRPLWGYSAMTGVSIAFTRLWKPQYEPF